MVDWLPVDPDEIRRSIERHDEAFLRGELSRTEFIRRKRFSIKVQREAVSRVFANSRLALKMARARLRGPGLKLAEKFQEVDEMDVAIQIRLRCLTAFAKLAMQYIFPTLRLIPTMCLKRIPTMYLKRHKR